MVSRRCDACLSLLSFSVTRFARSLEWSLPLWYSLWCRDVRRRNKGGLEVLEGLPRCHPKEHCKGITGIAGSKSQTLGGPPFDPFLLRGRRRKWLKPDSGTPWRASKTGRPITYLDAHPPSYPLYIRASGFRPSSRPEGWPPVRRGTLTFRNYPSSHNSLSGFTGKV